MTLEELAHKLLIELKQTKWLLTHQDTEAYPVLLACLRVAEHRGIERAAAKVEELWPKMMAKYVRMPTVNMRVANIVKAIRALAQGGK